uniref:Uncharacterized protein n=1 Tax=Pyrodinium bahamense TaxID=73915 RepID=A0A7S0A0G1_9DINO|mmetsp:Transcript_17383/g.48018  ORF Transcript_17383/g.48018 Transcript_17383/m.48018 type:complete len:377 (+) Transcript_17383:2-1132(+)
MTRNLARSAHTSPKSLPIEMTDLQNGSCVLLPSGQLMGTGSSDGESTCSDSLPTTRLAWGSRVGFMAVAAAACLVVLAAVGVKFAASSGQAAGDSLRSQLMEATAPEVAKDQRMQQSALRFLASEELMAVVAKHSVKHNPACQSSSLQNVPAICNATALTPFLVKHMSKRVQAMPSIVSEMMASVEIDGKTQEAVLYGTPHIADPQLPTIAEETVSTLEEAGRSAPEVAMRRLTEKLRPRSSQLTQLRAKLFPNAPELDPSVTRQTWQTILSAHGLHIHQEAGMRNPWHLQFDMTLPEGRNLTSALRSMPSGRELAPALFAPGVAPLATGAPVGGPPPPDDLAGDICAAIGLPLSHIVMASLHRAGSSRCPSGQRL